MKKKTPCRKVLDKMNIKSITLAEYLKVDRSTVCRWSRPKNKGGRGGIIPHKYHKKIKALAATMKVELDASDFLNV